jgi:hypothetical protein
MKKEKCVHPDLEVCEDCGCPSCTDCGYQYIPREEDCACVCHED